MRCWGLTLDFVRYHHIVCILPRRRCSHQYMAPKKKPKLGPDSPPELLEFGRPSYVSQRGLEHVLTTVAQRGLPAHLLAIGAERETEDSPSGSLHAMPVMHRSRLRSPIPFAIQSCMCGPQSLRIVQSC